MAFYPNESNIIAKPFVFEESHLPDQLVGRSKEIETLRACLEPAARQLKPLTCWMYGPSGCGKTCVVRHVLTDVEKTLGLRWAYLNCWETPTYFLVLDKLARQLRVLGAEAQIPSVKAAAITKALSGRPFVLVLDELDMIAPKERSTILYNLSAVPKMGLICITYRAKALAELDSRVTSRLNPIVILVDAYGREDILNILNARVEAGLFPGSWSEEAIERIATLAEGNARTAVQTLRNAVFLAERKRDRKLLLTQVDESWAGSGDLRKRHHLDALTPHHRLIHELVLTQGVVASGDLRNRYVEDCAQRNLRAVAPRTFTDYLRKLVTLGLLKEEVVIDEGRRRQFRAGKSI